MRQKLILLITTISIVLVTAVIMICTPFIIVTELLKMLNNQIVKLDKKIINWIIPDKQKEEME